MIKFTLLIFLSLLSEFDFEGYMSVIMNIKKRSDAFTFQAAS